MKKLFASLLIGLTAGVLAASAGNNTSLPFTDNFEAYTNGTPLIDGTNGWYGSSSSIIVSSNTAIAPAGSTNIALIPVDCTLSNRFSGITATNVWIQMDMRPSLYDGTNAPTVDTNVAGMFFVNTNGNFVLHNGPVTNGNPTNSSSWATSTSVNVGTNGTNWVRIVIREDFTAKTWDLYANNTLVSNNVGFINTALTNFVGFDLYNGATTSYIDNVSISATTPPGIIGLSTTALAFASTYTTSISNQSLTVVMTNSGQSAFAYSNTVTYGSGSGWLTFAPVSGTLAAGAGQVLTGTVDSASLTVGVYVATNTITADATNSPQSIVVTLTVSKANQASVTFSPAASQTYGTTQWLSASGGSGSGAFSFAVTNGPGSISSVSNLSLTSGTGMVWVVATKASDNNYNAASASASVAAEKATQSALTFNPATPQTYGQTQTLSASGGESTGGFSYSIQSGSGFSLAGADLTATNGIGSVTVRATKAADANYLEVYADAGVNAQKANQAAITFNVTSTQTYNTVQGLSAGGGSGSGAFSYAVVSGLGSISSGTNLTVTSGTGTVVVSATKAADDNYLVASNTASVTAQKASQTITFAEISAQPLANVTLTLSASASSGLGISYELTSGSGSISSNVLTFSTSGSKTVKAAQAGNDNYAAATDVSQTFGVYGSSPMTNTVIPWSDTFETYFNTEPLINGTNGWYGSSSSIIVQTNVVSSGSKAALIPVDCTLSNRFANIPSSNVYLQMDIRPSLYDGTNSPAVDTNVPVMFYVNSNGNFVVHNGSYTLGTNWVTVTNFNVGTNGATWVTVGILENFSARTWDLYASNSVYGSNVLVTNNIGFINTNLTNFVGFDVYNGAQTSYLDNVSVAYAVQNVGVTITNEPVSRTNAPGQSASFTVGASGTAPLYYQWRKGGSPVGTATNATYAFTVATNSGGNYDCVVSNMVNVKTSAVATLTVNFNFTNDTTITGDLVCDGPLTVAPGVRLTITGTLTLNGASTVGAGAFLTCGHLYIPAGSSLTVSQGTLTVAGATVSGTFILTDSPGSLYILDDFVVSGTNIWINSHIVVSNATKNVTIEAQNGSVFTVSNCLIEAASGSSNFAFIVRNGTTFSMTDTTNRNCGFASAISTNWGLFIDTPNALLQRNEFTNNYMGVVFGTNANGGALSRTKLQGNASNTVNNTGSATVDARSNWWGTAVSSEIVASFAGSVGPVLYSPWYSDANMTQLVYSAATQLFVKANNQSRAYGAANPVLTYRITDTNNEIVVPAGLTGSPTLSTTADVSSVVGSYVINCSTGTLAAPNCDFTAVNGELAVTRGTQASTNGYVAGLGTVQTCTVDGVFYFPTNKSLLSLTWKPELPTNWVLLSAAGDGSPVTTNGTDIVFQDFSFTNPIVFHYTFSVPAGETGAKTIGGEISYDWEDIVPIVFTRAEPDPLSMKMQLTITANSTNKIYGSTVTFAGTEFTASGLNGGDTVTNVTLTSAGATNTAGTGVYAIVASAAQGTGLMNYNITYVDGALTVGVKAASVTANSTNKTYGTTLAFAGTEFTTSGFVNGDAVTSVALISAGATSTATVAGSPYSIVPTNAAGSGLGNYTITYVNGALTVTAKALTITATPQNKEYGLTLSGTSGYTVFTSVGLTNGNTLTSATVAYTNGGDLATNAVGAYANSISLSAVVGANGFDVGNYSITYVPGTLTVTAKALTITATPQNKEYGLTLSGTSGYTVFTSVGLTNGNTLTSATVAYTNGGDLATNAVGAYANSISLSAVVGANGFDAGNYSITYVPGTLTVTAKALTITATAQNKEYGVALSGAAGYTVFTSVGLTNGNTLTSATVAYTNGGDLATNAVGAYANSISLSAVVGANGFDAGNYSITYVPGTLTVTAKALTITATAQNKEYGVALSGAAGYTVFTSVGLTNGNTLTSATVAYTNGGDLATNAVGAYANSISLSAVVGANGFDAGNYSITYVPGTLTVTAKALTITATAQNKTYGAVLTGAAGYTVFTSVGLTNGNTLTSATVAYTNGGDLATNAVGAYANSISLSAVVGANGFDAGNYSITYVPGTLTVTAKALTITATAQNKTYGAVLTGAAGYTVFTSVGLTNGNTLTSATVAYTNGGDLATNAVGAYANSISLSAVVGANGFDAGNYSITYVSGTLTVTAASLTVTPNAVSTNYSGVALDKAAYSTNTAHYAITGFSNSETIVSAGIVLSGSMAFNGDTATVVQAVGTYTQAVGSLTMSSIANNYVMNFTNPATNSYVITGKALTITAVDFDKAYGQEVIFDGTEFTTIGLVGGDSVTSVTISCVGTSYLAAVGTYPITPSAAQGVGLPNYTITYSNGTLTVTGAVLTITANNDSKTYGQTKSYGPGLTNFTSSGLQNGETIATVTITPSGGTASNAPVASYSLTPSAATPGTFNPANYSISYVAGTLAVNALPVYLTGTRPYDGSATAAYSILSVSNAVGTDVVSVVSGTAQLASANVGLQAITNMGTLVLGGAQSNNYTLNGASGLVEIVTTTVATGTHACVGYYSPSASMVVSNMFTYPDVLTLTNLVWSPSLPTGWTLLSATGCNSTVVGTNVTFPTIPTNRPVVFTYTVNVPGNAYVSNVVNATVTFAYVGGTNQTVNIETLPIFRYHSADFRAPKRKIDGTEVGRVLSYWRAGYYRPNTLGNDGYASSKTVYSGNTNSGLHSSDYESPYWAINASEMNRALSYWRADGYHVDLAGVDGYAPTNAGPGPSMLKFSGAMIAGADLGATVTLSGPATYVPGQTVTITSTFNAGADKLLGLGWTPQLPTGWTIVSVSGDGNPELVRGEILCVGASLDVTPMQLVCTVKVPLTETRSCTIGNKVFYMSAGMVNQTTLSATPIAMISASAAALANPLGGADLSLLKGVVNADFDGDRKADPSIYDESTGAWLVKFSSVTAGKENQVVANGSLGGIGWAPAAADYDGDGITDPAIYQESTGNWSVKLSGNGYAQSDLAAFLGASGWAPAAADYDGDGLADPAVYQEATGDWKVKLSSADYAETAVDNLLGSKGYSVVSADFDGDGMADPAVYNRADGTWKILLSGDDAAVVLPTLLGGAGWSAVPGDYDGDGLADPAVRKNDGSEWRIMLSGSGYTLSSVLMGL